MVQNNIEILNAISKVGTLMFVSIITSLGLFILIWFGISGVINIDTIVNVYCIILMHKTNETCYNKICSICHNNTYKCCINYIETQRKRTQKSFKKNNSSIIC